MKFTVNAAEVAEAVEILQADPAVEVWSIGTITYEHHAIPPHGAGFGVTLRAANETGVFEKASAKTLVAATREALRRLHLRLEGKRNA